MSALTELAAKAASDPNALHDLINDLEFRRKVRVIARKIFSSIPLRERYRDAEDLEQDIHERILRKIQTFEGRCEVHTWISKVARNIQLDRLKKNAVDESELSAEDGPVTSDPSREACLREAINRLDSEQRKVLELAVCGEKLVQISQRCGLSKSQVQRILVKVKGILTDAI